MKRIILGIFTLLVAGIAIAYYLDARIPRATAILQVHPAIHPPSLPRIVTSHYMECEFETIASAQTLASAAESLDLSPEEKRTLKEKITTEPIRGTDFIKIRVEHQDADQAIKIANAVAEAYVKRRAETEESRAARSMEALDNELVMQEEVIQKNLNEVQSIVEIYDIESEQAREHYEQSLAMLHEMRIKQQEARDLLKEPRKPVTMHERAKLTTGFFTQP